jgi:NTE family protein
MVPWEAVMPIARAHPAVLLSLCRTVVTRMRSLRENKRAHTLPRTVCILPHGDLRKVDAFVEELLAELNVLGPTILVTKEGFAGNTTDRLFALEAAHDHVVYLAEGDRTPWSRLCLRQADKVLVVAEGLAAAKPVEPFGDLVGTGIPRELVLLWPGKIAPGRTLAWLEATNPRAHYHVRARPDVGRAARLVTRRGLGVVLSGGGARGLAHVGIGSALQSNGVPIDAVIGTSIGALVGAAIAMEVTEPTSRARAHRFSRKHPLFEIVLPIRSLLSGRNVRTSLERWYGDIDIAETPIPFACVTANLGTYLPAVHVRGKLATWIRASTALPGIFPPVLDGGVPHVDGGIINNLPTDLIRNMGAGFVVAVDVAAAVEDVLARSAASAQSARTAPNIVELLMRVATLGSDARNSVLRQQCDVLLKPDLLSVGLMDFRSYDRAIRIGYECALEKIDRIKGRIPDAIAASPPASAEL